VLLLFQAYKQVVNDTSVFKLDLPSSRAKVGPGVKTHPESKCPELLAQYCDMLLRKTPLSKKLTSEEIEGKLKDVVCLNWINSLPTIPPTEPVICLGLSLFLPAHTHTHTRPHTRSS